MADPSGTRGDPTIDLTDFVEIDPDPAEDSAVVPAAGIAPPAAKPAAAPAGRPSAPSHAPAAAHKPVPADADAARMLIVDLEREIALGGDDARHARLLYEVGRIEEERLRIRERALARYQHAVAKNPDFVPAIRAARRILLERGSVQAALDLFDAEVRATPDPTRKAELCVAKAEIEEVRLGDRAAAAKSLVKALELDRQNRLAQRAYERILVRDEAWKGLDELYARMAESVAEDAPLRASLEVARARLREGVLADPDGAAAGHDRALMRDPGNLPALEGLRRLHLRAKRWKELADTMEEAAARSGDPRLRALDGYRASRILADRLGESDRAIASAERAAGADPTNALVLGELGRLYEMGGRWEDLAAVYRRELAATSDPRERLSRLHRLATICEEKLDRPDESMALFREALRVDATYLPALQGLGKLYRQRGMWHELVEMTLAELHKTLDPIRAAAGHYDVGQILRVELMQTDAAIGQFEKALAFDPSHGPAFRTLTTLYPALARFRELGELYERAADAAKQPAWAITYLEKAGAVWEELAAELDRAAAAFTRILDVDSAHLGAIHALQRVYERAGRFRDLVASLEREVEHAAQGAEVAAILHRIAAVHEGPIGDQDAALAAYRRVLQVEPRYRPALVALGRLLHAQGRWDDLLELYQAELDASPSGPERLPLLYKAGEIHEHKVGRVDGAERCYRAALDIDPSYLPAIRALARIYRDRGDWERLAEVLDAEGRTLSDPRQRAAAYFRVAEIYEERLGKDDLAADAYTAALKETPDDLVCLEALVRLHAARGDWHAVVELYGRQGVASDDPGTQARALLGQAEALAGPLAEPARAAECYEKALTLAPGTLVALVSLESLYRRLGRGEALAETEKRLAARLSDVPSRVAVLRELAQSYETRLRPPLDPVPVYREILSLAPTDGLALDALERIALAAREPAALADVLEKRIEAATSIGAGATELASLRARRAEALERADDPVGAAIEYRASLELEPDSLTAARGLGRVTQAVGDAEGAEDAARREAAALRDAPAAGRALLVAAEGAIRRRDVEAAVGDLERALELCPDSEPVATRLEAVLRSQGQERRLVDVATRAAAAATDPGRRAALHALVGTLQRDALGDAPAAVAAFGRALKSVPDHVPSLVAEGELLFQEGQANEAVAVFQKLLTMSRDPETTTLANLRLARLFGEKLGERARAVESLQRVLTSSPGHPEALARLAEFHRADGAFDRAAEVLGRLAELGPPGGRIETLMRLAEVQQEAGNANGAGDALRRAMTLEAASKAPHRALARLVALHGGRGDWNAAVDVYRSELTAVGESTPPAAPLHLALGVLYAERLGRMDDAVIHLRTAVKLAPAETDARIALASLLAHVGRPAEAASEHEALLAADPLRIESLRALRRLDEKLGQRDRMHLAEATLLCLRAAEAGEADSYRHSRVGRPRAPLSVLPTGAVSGRLAHPTVRMPASDLLAATSIHLGKVFPPDLDGYGLGSRSRIGPRDGDVLHARAREIADVLGIEDFQLYTHQQRGRGVAVEATTPAAIVVPEDLRTRSVAEQDFVFSSLLYSLVQGTFLVAKLTPRELQVHLAAIARTYVPGFLPGVVAESWLDERSRQIQKALPRMVRKAIEPLALQHAERTDFEPTRFVDAVGWSGDRAGLLFAEDLATALTHVQGAEATAAPAPTATEDVIERLRRSRRAVELLRFQVSDDHAILRRAIGTGEARASQG